MPKKVIIPEQEIYFQSSNPESEGEDATDEEINDLIGLLELADLMVLYEEGPDGVMEDRDIEPMLNGVDANRLHELPILDQTKIEPDQIVAHKLFVDQETGVVKMMCRSDHDCTERYYDCGVV